MGEKVNTPERKEVNVRRQKLRIEEATQGKSRWNK